MTECLCIFVTCNTVLSDDKDKFQEDEISQIITGSDPSVTAANVFDVRYSALSFVDFPSFSYIPFTLTQFKYLF